ncbi:MAG: gluconate 2-dehydrogenase subunit 3 family protein [Pseudomonadales bacterium]
MNRRELLQCAALLTAGSGIVPNTWALTSEQQTYLASRGSYLDRVELTFFSTAQRAMVAAMSELTIPRTDTPGAIDAGAPQFIEAMVAGWFNDDERSNFMNGLDALDKKANGYLSLKPKQQLELLEELEDEASDAAWYRMGNTMRIWDSQAPFICQFKELTILGFMLSETASRQFLQPNPMGSFEGSVNLKPEQRVYSTQLPMRSVNPPISAAEDL